jgi:hypothetical protein
MDTAQFLARVVPAAGNYLTVTWKSPARGWAVRSFPLANDGFNGAASMLRWASSKGADAYHAIAAFTAGEVTTNTRGEPHIVARREQTNVHLIKTLVIDADVKRDGDKKNPTTVFPDRRAAVAWLLKFTTALGMPLPNLGVNSGYGFHWYWLLEDPLTLAVWQPIADALKAAMLKHGWIGDTSPTIDGARILRPPGTANQKSGVAMPVTVIDKLVAADYPNDWITSKLAPYIGLVARSTGTHGASASVHTLGPRVMPSTGANLNAAAHAGIEHREYSFRVIGTKCEQVKQSLASHGNGDPYQLWYRNHLTLAAFCADGDDYVHPISDGDHRYDADNVNTHYQRIKGEVDRKAFGAPLCTAFDANRRDVCVTCPFWGKINSPITLGHDDGDLPDDYRRLGSGATAQIQRLVRTKDEAIWVWLMNGSVEAPQLDELAIGGNRLTFVYEYAGARKSVGLNGADLGPHMPFALLERQGISASRHNFLQIGDFAVAWINKLRAQQAQRATPLRPFGWNFGVAGEHIGVAIAGDHYRCDGGMDRVPGGDLKVAAQYRPTGTLERWREAAQMFEGSARPDLQTLIATAFAAPLFALCGDVRGMSMNFYSTASGIGKTSAMRVAQSVWGSPAAMQSMKDTFNAMMRSLSEPRILPRYWDELRVTKETQASFVEMIYTIPQGKERARLQSDITLREVGEWETVLAFTSNRSMMDYLLWHNDGTDSAVARLLEIEMRKIVMRLDASAGQRLKLTESNYGHAGRIYAQHIATNLPAVKTQLATIMQAWIATLKMPQEERFYATAMTCILVGASIARRLNLFDFDIRGIRDVLEGACKAARATRTDHTLVSPVGEFDLEELLGRCVYELADWRVHSRTLAGPGSAKLDLRGTPRFSYLKLQLVDSPPLLRISRSALFAWLREANIPAVVFVEQLVNKLGATVNRRAIGGGTPWGGGQIWCVDVPLVGALLDTLDLPNAGPSTSPRQAPGAALAGNQPTI